MLMNIVEDGSGLFFTFSAFWRSFVRKCESIAVTANTTTMVMAVLNQSTCRNPFIASLKLSVIVSRFNQVTFWSNSTF